MGKIEKFNNESDLLQRIDELKQEGAGESDLQVISEDKLEDNSLDYTDVKVKSSRGSFSDKITALFSGESSEERVLSSVHVPEEKLDEYKADLNNGKILLYIDNDNLDDSKNYDSEHPKGSQSGNEHYDNTKPFSNEGNEESGVSKGTAAGAAAASSSKNDNDTSHDQNEFGNADKENEFNRSDDVSNNDVSRNSNEDNDSNGVSKGTVAGAGLGAGAAGAAAASSSKNDNDTSQNQNEFGNAERENEFNRSDDVSNNDLTHNTTEKTDSPSFDNEAETDRSTDTNRYGNSIDKEEVAHDDVDNSNFADNNDDTSTSANLAGASGLGAAGYANKQSDEQETQVNDEDNRKVYSSDNERDLEALNNREKTNTTYRETDNVKDQQDLSRNDDSSFSRVHDDDVEAERSTLNYDKPNESVEPPASNVDTTRESNFSTSQNERDTNINASNQSFNDGTRNDKDEDSVQLHEERLNVDKENVETGEASVDKRVVEEQEEFDVPVESEEVTIERRPVNEKVDEDFNAQGDDSVRVPLHEERVNVDKENVVSEEIVIKKNKVQDTEHVSEKVRREEADINNPTEDNNRR
ncbi:DUF2382 domain-containing protein [Mammaliicoccus fleurettii]|uniref:DUF2382 domain-containing protein n=1 Tax=Mammaliicoccus fleurettii TaxID=150056 RepID=UPI002DB5D849|nr:DUF2382 domain-containing protein [Mammaliicoccus fleurettii]MEB8067503.1 DUF2382 domain-containing protein [Mammaliicoccus fleurettii]